MCFGNSFNYRKAENKEGSAVINRFLSDHEIMAVEDQPFQSSREVSSYRNTIIRQDLETNATNRRTPIDTRVVDTGNLTLFDRSSSINDHLDAFDFNDLDSVSVSDSFSKFS